MHAPVLSRLIALALGFSFSLCASAADFWVSPDGSDKNPGTKEQPLASVELAQRKARELRRLSPTPPDGGTRIMLKDGLYFLQSPLLFRSDDSGTAESPASVQAAPGARPTLSGGQRVGGWKPLATSIAGMPSRLRSKLWISEPVQRAGQPLVPRQLWVNGRKAERARSPDGETLNRLLEWNVAEETAVIPTKALPQWGDLSRLEMVIHQQWAVAFLRIKSIQTEGARAVLRFHAPESRIQFEHPWPAPIMDKEKGNAPYFLANSLALLNEPGEWYQEMPGGRILYYPREGEDMSKAEAFVPVLENIIRIAGTEERPVAHLSFEGLTFSHSTYSRPSAFGHVPLQAGMAMVEAYTLNPNVGVPYKPGLCNLSWTTRPTAAVLSSDTLHLRFTACRFEHLGGSGLDLDRGTRGALVEGNRFRDIAFNGLQAGKFSDDTLENHYPYDPMDEREIVTQVRIANNLLTDCGTDDWGAVGIVVGFAREVAIEHNEVSWMPYTGISLGWGWTKSKSCLRDNRVHANHVHHVATRMCDTAGIYSLSSQPGTMITENCVEEMRMSPYVFNPEHWFYLYLDEGSSHVVVRDNWCPAERFLANANGPDNVWERNGPQVSETIRKAAGLEPAYRHLKD